MLVIRYYATGAGRSQPVEFLNGLMPDMRAQIVADIALLSEHLGNAPVSWKPIKGKRYLYEIRIGNYRVFYFVRKGVLWVLHACKKQDQRRGIEAAANRMKEVMEGSP